ncbi:MAG: glycosyltransferase [Bergeyella sp.]|nr:glycosyltransferase [Bergeyella sp.]
MTKKKILIRIGSLRHGGAEKTLTTFLKKLSRDKYDIDLLLNLYSGKYLPEVPDWINIVYLNRGEMIPTNYITEIPKKIYRKSYQGFLKIFPRVLYRGKLKNKKYDIEMAAIQGLRDEILRSPIKTSKKIVWIHNDLSKVRGYDDREIKKFFGYDKIWVISSTIEELFIKNAGNPADKNKIVRIYNPIDKEDIIKKSREKVRLEHREKNIPTFLSVGTVFPQKGFDRLLKAHKRLLDEGLKHKVLIIGDGYDLKNIMNLRNDLRVKYSVEMPGYVENPYPYFRKADFYVQSSRYEGFPTVLYEAISLRKNIIATEVSGTREILKDGKLGLIVPNSEEGIYRGMKKSLLHPEIFIEIQKNIAQHEETFSLENSVNFLSQMLDDL